MTEIVKGEVLINDLPDNYKEYKYLACNAVFSGLTFLMGGNDEDELKKKLYNMFPYFNLVIVKIGE